MCSCTTKSGILRGSREWPSWMRFSGESGMQRCWRNCACPTSKPAKNDPQIVRGELAGRASVHAETIARKLDALPEADRSLRRRNRKIAVAIRTTGGSGEPAAAARPQAEATEPQKTSANEKPENRLRSAEGGL